MQTDTRPAAATATEQGTEPPAGTSEAGGSRDDAERGGGHGARGNGETTAAGAGAAASSSGEWQTTAPSEATAMDEDEVDMECDEGDGGASSSGGRQAALEQGFDVDALEVRAANETSAKLAAQAGEQVGVRKRHRSKRPNGKQRQNEAKAKAAGQQRPGAGW